MDEGYLQKLFACSTMTSNKQTKEGNRQMAESILVVDDEQEIADLVEVYLQNEGYTVHKFYNAKDALNCLDKTTISLALLDVMLPDMDGFSLCRQIRQKFYFPIIMLTAKVEDMDKIMDVPEYRVPLHYIFQGLLPYIKPHRNSKRSDRQMQA